MFDIEVDPSTNSRLMFMRYLKANSDEFGESALYVTPTVLARDYSIILSDIQAVLTLLENLGHIEITQKPNYRLTDRQRAKRDDEEDYYVISLSPSFNDYYSSIETASTFYIADEVPITGNGIKASLRFEGITTPVVSVAKNDYKLPSMRDGVPFQVVSYCLEKRPGQTLGIERLRAELDASNLSSAGITNFNENLRNSLFGNGKPLRPFVTASSKSILVTPTASLSPKELETIIQASREHRNSS